MGQVTTSPQTASPQKTTVADDHRRGRQSQTTEPQSAAVDGIAADIRSWANAGPVVVWRCFPDQRAGDIHSHRPAAWLSAVHRERHEHTSDSRRPRSRSSGRFPTSRNCHVHPRGGKLNQLLDQSRETVAAFMPQPRRIAWQHVIRIDDELAGQHVTRQ